MDKPILFSAEMVRAILEGRKTQTRRIVNLKGHAGQQVPLRFKYTIAGWWSVCEGEERFITIGGEKIDGGLIGSIKCPFGKIGNRLWVRETWRLWDSKSFTSFGEPLDPDVIEGSLSVYSKEYLKSRPLDYHATNNDEGPWRPSIHMPRWASRITLEITGIRVERLQDITEEDAKAEGVDLNGPIGNISEYLKWPYAYHFANLWESINGLESWDANPWVWVIEFKRIDQ